MNNEMFVEINDWTGKTKRHYYRLVVYHDDDSLGCVENSSREEEMHDEVNESIVVQMNALFFHWL